MARAAWFCLALFLLLSSLLLLLVFVTWRGRLAAVWLGAAGVVALITPWKPTAVRWLRGAWLVGLLGLFGLAPGNPPASSPIGCVAPWWLRFSPFNLVPEQDLSDLGLRLFYPGQRGQEIRALTAPLYAAMEENCASGVLFSATGLFGLGTGSGHLYRYAPQGKPRPLVIFLHGAMGNLQCYLQHWRLYAERRGLAVVCPTFGFGSWFRPGGTETAASAWSYAQQQLPVELGPALVIGHSNGATGALRLAAAHPEMVAGLVLISPVLEPEIIRSPAFVEWARQHPPPLVLMGDSDANVSPGSVQRGVEEMQAQGLRVDYRVFKGHDHFLMFSDRDEIFQALDEWQTRQQLEKPSEPLK